MHKFRILMVAPTPFPGNRGTPSRILDMPQGLARLENDVHVVSYRLQTETPTAGIMIHRIPNIPTYVKMDSDPCFQNCPCWICFELAKRSRDGHKLFPILGI